MLMAPSKWRLVNGLPYGENKLCFSDKLLSAQNISIVTSTVSEMVPGDLSSKTSQSRPANDVHRAQSNYGVGTQAARWCDSRPLFARSLARTRASTYQLVVVQVRTVLVRQVPPDAAGNRSNTDVNCSDRAR